MKLAREPFVPTQYELAAIASRMLPSTVHPTWEPFLGRESSSSSSSSSQSVEEEQELYLETRDE